MVWPSVLRAQYQPVYPLTFWFPALAMGPHGRRPSVAGGAQVITKAASMRVAEYAFQYARDNGRKRIAAVHKAVRAMALQCRRSSGGRRAAD